MDVKATIRALDTDGALAEGLAELGRLDPVMARLVAEGARPALRKREPGFHGLAWIVMGQQLSVASADAIWKRLVERLGPLTPSTVEAAEDATLKSCGLSAPKLRTLRAIAAAIASGSLPFDELGEMPADAAHAALTAVKGIGPWTADIYLMFSLGHPDAFAAGDLALQEAARLAYRLAARPSASELVALAEKWRPWRAVAATVLWAHYKIARKRPGVSESAKPNASALKVKRPGKPRPGGASRRPMPKETL
jgi:DNA-3-methyladenine glycosylase II